MNATVRLRVFVLTLLISTSSLVSLSGCGGDSNSESGPTDPATQSASRYEAEIAKNKAAAPGKPAK